MARRSNRRRQREASFEIAMYGLIIVLFLLTLLYPALRAEWISLIGGAILVGSAIYQSNQRWRVNVFTWIGGLLLLGIGLLSIQTGQGVPLGIFLPFGVMLGVIVAGFFTGNL